MIESIFFGNFKQQLYNIYYISDKMGNEPSPQQIREGEDDQKRRDKLKKTIEQNMRLRKLKLNHHANIFQKCQILQENYQAYYHSFEELHLTHNLISTQGINLLAKMNVTNLKVLVLSHNDIICDSLKVLRDMNLRTLEYLHLDHNKIANDGCYYLTRTNFQSLLTLNLDNNNIEAEGCKHLARAILPNIRTLLINNNLVNERGLRYLALGEWPLLCFIQLKENKFEANKKLEQVKFRSQVKLFRLEIH